MDVTPYVTQLREDLAAAAAAGDEDTRRTAALLAAAIGPSVRLVIMNALSDMAAEVTAALDDRVVEIRLDGGEVRISVSGETAPASVAIGGPAFSATDDATGDVSRITLRLLDQLKGQAERAAAQQGVSLNSWLAQAVQGALHGVPPRTERKSSSNRLRGWVQG